MRKRSQDGGGNRQGAGFVFVEKKDNWYSG